jgi:TolB-like protein/class 3 adenylate cyclase/Tfp pilus assembly protein PilF
LVGEQRHLAAIVSADVIGYSRLMGRDESGTLAALKALRRELVDPAIAAHGGRIVKTTGDGLLMEFSSVVEAVRCVIAVQRQTAQRNDGVPEDRRIVFRVGVNLGDIIIDDGDIFGDGVNIAARLQAVSPPGGMAVSDRVYEDVRDRVDERFVDGGEQALKNIARKVRIHHWTPFPDTARGAPPSLSPWYATRRVHVLAAALLLLAAGAAGWLFLSPPSVPGASSTAAGGPAPGTAPRTPVRTGIAVLPFVNLSGDAAQDYFSDGVTEDLIAALGRFPALAVSARSATFAYKGKIVRHTDIGRELNVRYIVEGSVRRAGPRVRVSAQLSDAAAGSLLWSHQYDEELRDVFALQDAVTRHIAGALAVNLGRIEQQRAAAKPTDNLDAYDLVLRGREKFRLTTRAGNRQARALFEQAIRLDPRYADAYAALARAFGEVATLGWAEDLNAVLELLLENAQKALALDPDNCEAISVMAFLHTTGGQYDLALAASDRALAINPSHAEIMLERAAVLVWLGRIDDAVSAAETALRVEPNPRAGPTFNVAMAYYQARRHADAIRLLERGVLRFPEFSFFYALLAASYGQLERSAEAATALAELRRRNPFFDLAASGTRFQNPEHRAYFIDGLVKAGLR